MGSFNAVRFKCQNLGCKGFLRVQTKGGDCMGKVFPSSYVPISDASSIRGDEVICSECQTKFKVRCQRTVEMKLIPLDEELEVVDEFTLDSES
jgi:hypothetical protein